MKLPALLVTAFLALPSVAFAEHDTACAGEPRCLASSYGELMSSQMPELSLGTLVVFEPGRVRIRSDARDVIRELAESWVDNPTWGAITVEGFADAAGRADEDNAALAARRAAKVRGYLIRYGVDPSYIVVAAAAGPRRGGDRIGRRVDLAIDTSCDPLVLSCRRKTTLSSSR
jgi:outer membrane protein OmpA-like peptidoglycan-associated protein